MELEEAIKNVKDEINVDKNNLPIAEANEYEEERTLMLNRIEAKETILNHLTKQDKMIKEYEEMIIRHKEQLRKAGIYGYDYDLKVLTEEIE